MCREIYMDRIIELPHEDDVTIRVMLWKDMLSMQAIADSVTAQ